jgi:hypothetical protein
MTRPSQPLRSIPRSSTADGGSMTDKPRCTCAAGDGAYLAAHGEICAVTKFARRAASSPVKATRKLAASILRDLVVEAPKQIQEAWEDVVTERIDQFVLERVSEQRNRAEVLEKEWRKIDIELRRAEAERDALKHERFWEESILIAFTLSLFAIGFLIVALLERSG